MSDKSEATLSNLLHEERRFEPPAELAAHANVTADAYAEAEKDRLGFWGKQAERITWSEPFDEVLDWSNPPFAKWYVGGRLNAAYNCVDRHVEAGNGDRVAIHWVGEPEDDARSITYAELQAEVCRAANALTELGVREGDRVAIYMPMIPETVVAMLACARLGAPHTVVFGGFSADALASRVTDCGAKVVVTSDGGYRRGAPSALKPAVDEAVAKTGDLVEKVLVVRRTGQDVDWTEGRDVWWHEAVGSAPAEHTAEAFDAEHPLYVMYTSGTTGKPKGILHTTGGYLVGCAYTHWAVFDLKPETDVYWCTADVGWVTGHSYMVYGPLANGATQVMYEGTPDSPHKGRWWEIIEKYGVTIFYTAPTAIRTFMKWGDEIPEKFDLSSIRILGSVGESINPEAYMWYRKTIGADRCPVVDTWWQTETGQIMISPLPGVTAGKPGSAMTPLPGISAEVVNDEAKAVGNGEGGYLVPHRAVAGHAPHDLGRRPAVQGHLLVALPRPVLRRRRRQARRGRRHLAARPRGRRHERLRPPALHDGDRVGARLPPEGRRGGRRGRHRRDHRPGGLRVRHPAGVGGPGGRRAGRGLGAGQGAAQPRGPRDRRHRQASADHDRERAAQDPVGQDHAPAAARRRREPRGR